MKVFASTSVSGLSYTADPDKRTCTCWKWKRHEKLIPPFYRNCPHLPHIDAAGRRLNYSSPLRMIVLSSTIPKQRPPRCSFSRKHDGIRIHVVGHSHLLTRNGMVVNYPGLTDMGHNASHTLDGELTLVGDSSSHNDVMNAIYEQQWDKLTIRVFDMVDDMPFEERQKTLKRILQPTYLIEQHPLLTNDIDELQRFITKNEWEGIVVRNMDCILPYDASCDIRDNTIIFKIKDPSYKSR